MENPLSNDIYHSRRIPRIPDIRGDYFRDQTAIIHATPFRRLKYKTQVFFSPQNDHICTRIEHVLHVSTIASTICKGLNLDIELAQAIALGHDLGHAPFGHIGEKTLNILAADIGGFIHEIHSLRVVDKIARNGKGLNLTYAVRDGIVSHCGEDFQKCISPYEYIRNLENITQRQKAPVTLEGCVVRFSDKIAYLGRDIEDAITIGLLSKKDIPSTIKRNLGMTNGEIIDTLVKDVIKTSIKKKMICFSDKKFKLITELKEFNYHKIYNHPLLLKSDTIIKRFLEQFYLYLQEIFLDCGFKENNYKKISSDVGKHFGKFISERKFLYRDIKHPKRCIVDFIAGMTDSFVIDAAKEILLPKPI